MSDEEVNEYLRKRATAQQRQEQAEAEIHEFARLQEELQEELRDEQLKPFRAWVAVQDKQGPMLSDSEDAPRLFPTLERLKWCVLCRLGDSLIYQCDPNSEFAQKYAEKRMRETGWRIVEVLVQPATEGPVISMPIEEYHERNRLIREAYDEGYKKGREFKAQVEDEK